MNGPFALAAFLPFRLNRLAAEVSERLADLYCERFDLDVAQWRVLATLAAGENSAHAIVASTRTHKSTISRAVHALKRRQLVERVPSALDRRAFVLRLTARGQALFLELRPLVLRFEAELLANMGERDARSLLRGANALERALALT
jgi:DNA-binding MarR family transcriptional regulator